MTAFGLLRRYRNAAIAAVAPSPGGGGKLCDRVCAGVARGEYAAERGVHIDVDLDVARAVECKHAANEGGVGLEPDIDEDAPAPLEPCTSGLGVAHAHARDGMSITPSGWHLRRPHSQRRQARQLTCPASNQSRVLHQSQVRQSARYHRSAATFRRADEVIE